MCVWLCRDDADAGNLLCLRFCFQNTITTTDNRFSGGVGKVWNAWVLWVGLISPHIEWQGLRFPLLSMESKFHSARLILGCDGFPAEGTSFPFSIREIFWKLLALTWMCLL